MTLVDDPRLQALLTVAIILTASWLVAFVISWLMCRVLRRVRRTASAEDDARIALLKRSLGRSIFFFGGTTVSAVLPVGESWRGRILQTLVALGIVFATMTFIRAWRLVLSRTGYDRDGSAKPWAKDFEPLLSTVGSVALGMFGLIALLRSFDIDVNSLVVSLGVGSLAVGLAAQDTLANMFAGFALMADRPFLIGDRIQLASGETGDVEAIGIRATRMRTLDDTLLIVPNRELTKERVVNLSRPGRSVIARLDVGVAYGSDLEKARRIVTEAVLSSGYVDRGHQPDVLVTKLGDFSIGLRAVFSVRDYTELNLAVSEVYEAIYRDLARAGIEIPYPVQRQIHEAVEQPRGEEKRA